MKLALTLEAVAFYALWLSTFSWSYNYGVNRKFVLAFQVNAILLSLLGIIILIWTF